MSAIRARRERIPEPHQQTAPVPGVATWYDEDLRRAKLELEQFPMICFWARGRVAISQRRPTHRRPATGHPWADALAPEDVGEARETCQHIALAEFDDSLGVEGRRRMSRLRARSVGRAREAVRRMREVLSPSPGRKVAPET